MRVNKSDRNYILLILGVLTLGTFVTIRNMNNPINTMGYTSDSLLYPTYDTSFPVIITNYEDSVFPSIFEAAFASRTYIKRKNVTEKLKVVNIGKIDILTGRIVVGDHVLMHTYEPFNMDFPTGEFDVELSVTEGQYANFIRVKFSENPVSKWEYPEYKHEQRKPITDKSYFPGFGVDAGMAFIADSMVHQMLIKKGDMPPFLTNELGRIENLSIYNYANFVTGLGDGWYACYVGYDNNGDISRLLIDFNMIRWI